jgi:uncharacterized protein (TIGR03086 family)
MRVSPIRSERTSSDVDLTAGDWRGELLALLDEITSSWASPNAWAGETSMGTPHTLPASVLGDMIVGELAVHGWDLAVATGQRLTLPANLLTQLHDAVSAGVEQGREMGLYGPEVSVSADAPTLDRILGLTGRDPPGLRGSRARWQARASSPEP